LCGVPAQPSPGDILAGLEDQLADGEPGTYVLQLQASDGELMAANTVTVTVQ
jgi:hypothetical protein